MYIICASLKQMPGLIDKLQQHNLYCIALPLMDFNVDLDKLAEIKSKINNYDYIVLNSPSVIDMCTEIIQNVTKSEFLVVGESSAKKLKLITSLPIHYPVKSAGARSLCNEVLSITQLINKKILIIKGEDGSLELAKYLKSKNVIFNEISFYKRLRISPDKIYIKKNLKNKALQGIIITSNILVDWLFDEATANGYTKYLLGCRFFTIHAKIGEKLKSLGIKEVFVTTGTNHNSLISLIRNVHE